MRDVKENKLESYPIKFMPLFKDYLWGGQNLRRLGKSFPGSKAAESWEISAHPDGMSLAANGPFTGKSLAELVSDYGSAFVGSLSQTQYGLRFPLLIKLIDAADILSVQVHPHDAYAAQHEKDQGKTEMWLILEAEPGAVIIYGFRDSISQEGFLDALAKGKIGECLQTMPVKSGDLIYIPAGTVHAIGKGIIIAEIQQNSNATYRLYDYDRKNADGSSRPLHLQKALDVIDWKHGTRNGLYEGLSRKQNGGLIIRPVVADPHFCTEIITVKGEAELLSDDRSFQTLIITAGTAQIPHPAAPVTLARGESVLIPANMGLYSLKGDFSALRSYIGDREADIIKPLLEAGYSKEEILKHVAGLDSDS